MPLLTPRGGLGRPGQLGVAATGFEDEQGDLSDRFTIGQPETVTMLASPLELRMAVGLAGQPIVLQLTAASRRSRPHRP